MLLSHLLAFAIMRAYKSRYSDQCMRAFGQTGFQGLHTAFHPWWNSCLICYAVIGKLSCHSECWGRFLHSGPMSIGLFHRNVILLHWLPGRRRVLIFKVFLLVFTLQESRVRVSLSILSDLLCNRLHAHWLTLQHMVTAMATMLLQARNLVLLKPQCTSLAQTMKGSGKLGSPCVCSLLSICSFFSE